ncbi:hypothetical protein [Macrococcoides canis]|uniref:hypothetical protein n=1 Tax=Macrococcoides canis TaxID=1855823 RepID=UPI0012FF82EC|nr:hypothetical protein [Macrococcus canis]
MTAPQVHKGKTWWSASYKGLSFTAVSDSKIQNDALANEYKPKVKVDAHVNFSGVDSGREIFESSGVTSSILFI